MGTWGVILHTALTAYLAVWLQWERTVNKGLAEGIVDAYKWIDDIIEALRNPDEVAGDRAIHGLVAKRSNDERPVLPVD